MFLITAFSIITNLKLCTCNSENNQNMASNIFGFDDFEYDFIFDLPNTSDVEYNNNLNAFPPVDNEINTKDKNDKILTGNIASNNLNFDPEDFLSFLDNDCSNNQECVKVSETTAHESSFSNRDTASSNFIDDLYGLPQPKRQKIAEELTENDYLSDKNKNLAANPTFDTNFSSPSSPSNSEVEKQLYFAIQDLYKGMIDEVKQQYSAIKQKIEVIKELFGRGTNFNSVIINSKQFTKFLIDFIKKQESLLDNITPDTEYHPKKSNACIEYLNEERLKLTFEKSVKKLNKEYAEFLANIKNYFSKNMENLIDIEVINTFYEVFELYLKVVLSDNKNMANNIKYAIFYFQFQYSAREYKIFNVPSYKTKIFSACMNSKYIYVIYGNYHESVESKIIKISNTDKSEKPTIHEIYVSKDKTCSKRFDKVCKRILTDSEGRIYILQMDDRNPTILVLNENFEEVDLIDSTRLNNDIFVPNRPCIADILLHKNKLYLLDCNNQYIYCYSLDLKYESKIEIPGDFTITKRNGFFSFSQNYIFIVDNTSFFAFIPNSKLFVEARDFINPKASNNINSGFICLNENMIAFKKSKMIYLHEFEIENTGESLKFKDIDFREISLRPVFEMKSNIALLKSPEDESIKIISITNKGVKLAEYD